MRSRPAEISSASKHAAAHRQRAYISNRTDAMQQMRRRYDYSHRYFAHRQSASLLLLRLVYEKKDLLLVGVKKYRWTALMNW